MRLAGNCPPLAVPLQLPHHFRKSAPANDLFYRARCSGALAGAAMPIGSEGMLAPKGVAGHGVGYGSIVQTSTWTRSLIGRRSAAPSDSCGSLLAPPGPPLGQRRPLNIPP